MFTDYAIETLWDEAPLHAASTPPVEAVLAAGYSHDVGELIRVRNISQGMEGGCDMNWEYPYGQVFRGDPFTTRYYLEDRESTRQDEVDREISSDYQVSELSIFHVAGLTTLPCIEAVFSAQRLWPLP